MVFPAYNRRRVVGVGNKHGFIVQILGGVDFPAVVSEIRLVLLQVVVHGVEFQPMIEAPHHRRL